MRGSKKNRRRRVDKESEADFTQGFRDRLAMLRELDAPPAADDVVRQWKFGQVVLAVQNGPEGDYGREGVVALARLCGRGKDYLYDRALVSDEWTVFGNSQKSACTLCQYDEARCESTPLSRVYAPLRLFRHF